MSGMSTKTTILAIISLSAIASADPRDKDCPHIPKKVVPKRPRPRPTPKPPQVAPSCQCKGEKGDVGPQGPKGDPGEVLVRDELHVITHVVRAEPAVRLSFGATGALQVPHGDWAWGPALRATTDLSEKYSVSFIGGLADIAAKGRESGLILGAQIERHIDSNIGFSVGIESLEINGSKDNGFIDGSYLFGTLGASYETKRFRFEAGPTIGRLRDDTDSTAQFALGVFASAFVKVGF